MKFLTGFIWSRPLLDTVMAYSADLNSFYEFTCQQSHYVASLASCCEDVDTLALNCPDLIWECLNCYKTCWYFHQRPFNVLLICAGEPAEQTLWSTSRKSCWTMWKETMSLEQLVAAAGPCRRDTGLFTQDGDCFLLRETYSFKENQYFFSKLSRQIRSHLPAVSRLLSVFIFCIL